MNPMSVDIKDILVDNSIGYFLGDSPLNPLGLVYAISVAQQPENPTKCISIYDTGGSNLQDTFASVKIDSEYVQIVVRSDNFLDGRAKIDEIMNLIDPLGNYTTAAGYHYEGFHRGGFVNFLGKDKNDNFLHTIGYDAIRIT